MIYIAIDYDDTFTADPDLWRTFIVAAISRGHSVVCITARRKTLENQKEIAREMPDEVDLHFSYDEPKAAYAKRNGVPVDVWIDDSPGWIVGQP